MISTSLSASQCLLSAEKSVNEAVSFSFSKKEQKRQADEPKGFF